jgi:hypothetical protein
MIADVSQDRQLGEVGCEGNSGFWSGVISVGDVASLFGLACACRHLARRHSLETKRRNRGKRYFAVDKSILVLDRRIRKCRICNCAYTRGFRHILHCVPI